jgi:hypothetical protein
LLSLPYILWNIIIKKASNVWLHPHVNWVLGQFQFSEGLGKPRNKYVFFDCNKNTCLGSFTQVCIFVTINQCQRAKREQAAIELKICCIFVTINQCQRAKREQAAIEFKICFKAKMMCCVP